MFYDTREPCLLLEDSRILFDYMIIGTMLISINQLNQLQMQKQPASVLCSGDSERQALLNLKRSQLRSLLNFGSGNFEPLIQSIINEEPESETLIFLQLEDQMPRKAYIKFTDLINSDQFENTKKEIRQIKSEKQKLQSENYRESLQLLLRPFKIETAPLIDTILLEAKILDEIKATNPVLEYEKLIKLLDSEPVKAIRYHLRNKRHVDQIFTREAIKKELIEMTKEIREDLTETIEAALDGAPIQALLAKMEDKLCGRQFKQLRGILQSQRITEFRNLLNDQQEREIASSYNFRAELLELFQEFKADTSALINAILQRESVTLALDQLEEEMTGRQLKKLAKIMESDKMVHLKALIQSQYQKERISQLRRQKRVEIVEKLQPFQVNLDELADNIFEDVQIEKSLVPFKEVLSFKQYKRLESVVKEESLKIKRILQKPEPEPDRQLQRNELSALLQQFKISDVGNLIDSILKGQPEENSVEILAEKLSYTSFKKLQAILKSEQVLTIKKRIGKRRQLEIEGNSLLENRKRLEKELSQFNIDFNRLVKAFLMNQFEQEAKALDELSDSMSGREYTKLVRLLSSQSIKCLRHSNMSHSVEQEINTQTMPKIQQIPKKDLPQVKAPPSQELKGSPQLKSEENSDLEKASALFLKGKDYCNQKNYPLALENLLQCLHYQEKGKGKDSFQTGLTHAWIGAVYYWQFDYSNAGQVYKDAIRIYETHKVSDINYAAALNNLGRTYYWSKNYPLAIENLEKSLALFQKMKNSDWAKQSAEFLAKSLKALNEHEKADLLVSKYDLIKQSIVNA